MGTPWKQSVHVASSNAHIAISARLCIELGQNPNKNGKKKSYDFLPCCAPLHKLSNASGTAT
jgi:hypothetical protein